MLESASSMSCTLEHSAKQVMPGQSPHLPSPTIEAHILCMLSKLTKMISFTSAKHSSILVSCSAGKLFGREAGGDRCANRFSSNGRTVQALPLEETVEVLRRYGVVR